MHRTPIMTAVLAFGVFTCAAASAQESPWSWKLGPAHLAFNSSTSVFLGGQAVPGGDAKAKDNTTLGLEIGYRLTPEWTGRLLVGLPPTTTLTAAGTLTGVGDLGKVTYGPAALTMTYGLAPWGAIQPYVGAGIAYNIVFQEKDRVLTDLKVRNSWGSVLQVGFDMPLDKDWSIGLDLRKVFLKAKATGTAPPGFGSAPVSATVKLDPLVYHLSVSKRF